MLLRRKVTDGEGITDTLCMHWIRCLYTLKEVKKDYCSSFLLHSTNVLKMKNGFGLNEVIGIAAGIIIAGLVIIPGLISFSELVMTRLESWWIDISDNLFISN